MSGLDFSPQPIQLEEGLSPLPEGRDAPEPPHRGEGPDEPQPVQVQMNGVMTNFRNPGRFGEMQKESRVLAMMDVIKGFEMEYRRGVSQHLSATHSLRYPEGDQDPQSYNFALQYVSPKQDTVLTARIDTDGILNGRFIANVNENLNVSLSAQTGPDTGRSVSAFSAEVAYRGPDYTTEAVYATSMHQWCASYVQQVTSRLQLGVQGVYLHERAASWLSVGARYEDEDNAASLVVEGLQGAVASYTRKVTKQVKATSELRMQLSNPQNVIDTQAMFGWEYQLRMHTCTTTFDTAGTLRTVLEDNHNGMGGLFLTFAAEINFPQRYYKFGARMTLQL